MSLKKAIEKRYEESGKIEVLRHDNFAYKDDAGRWRAGELAQTRKAGQFLSAGDAQRIRASASHAIEASERAVQFKRQKQAEPVEALKKGYKFVTERRKQEKQFKRQGIPDAHERAKRYTEDIFTLQDS